MRSLKLLTTITTILASHTTAMLDRQPETVRKDYRYQDRRIYKNDLVITKFKDEVNTAFAKNLYFSTNASRDAFTALNCQNTNELFSRNLINFLKSQHQNCIIDALEVDKGVIGIINCDLSIEFYQFSSGLISLDFLGMIPARGYGLTPGNCSEVFLSGSVGLGYLGCENFPKNEIFVFEVKGVSFRLLGVVNGMGLGALEAIFVHKTPEKNFVVIAKKIEKNATQGTIYVAAYPDDEARVPKSFLKPKNAEIGDIYEVFIEKKFGLNSTILDAESRSEVSFVSLDDRVYVAVTSKSILTPLSIRLQIFKIESKFGLNDPVELELSAKIAVKPPKHNKTPISTKLKFFVLTKQRGDQDPQKLGLYDKEAQRIMLCPLNSSKSPKIIQNQNCLFYSILSSIDLPADKNTFKILRIYPEKDQSITAILRSPQTKKFFLVYSNPKNHFQMILHHTDAALLARRTQFIYLNNTNLYRREKFAKIGNTPFLMNTTKLAQNQLLHLQELHQVQPTFPELTFEEFKWEPEVKFVPDAVLVDSRFGALEVDLLTPRIAVRENSLFAFFLLKDRYSAAGHLFSVKGNPSKMRLGARTGGIAELPASVGLYLGEKIDFGRIFGVDPRSENLTSVGSYFVVANNRTNELKIWVICGLKLTFLTRSVDCLANTKISLNHDFELLTARTDFLLPSRGSNTTWTRLYALIESKSANKTCLVQITFHLDRMGTKVLDETKRMICYPGVYRFAEFAVIHKSEIHYLLLCSVDQCEAFYREIGHNDKSTSTKIATITSQDPQIRSRLLIAFVREFGSSSNFWYLGKYSALFLIKSSSSKASPRQKSPKTAKFGPAEKMVNFYFFGVPKKASSSSSYELLEWHLLHTELDLIEAAGDPTHYFPAGRERLYQMVYWPPQAAFTLYDRRVDDFGVDKVINAYRLDENFVVVVGRGEHSQGDQRASERTILLVLALFQPQGSYHQIGSHTNLDTLRFRQEFSPEIRIDDVFPLNALKTGLKLHFRGFFVVKIFNETSGKSSFLLRCTLDEAVIELGVVKNQKNLKFNLSLQIEETPKISNLGAIETKFEQNSTKIHLNSTRKSITVEVFVSKICYDFELQLRTNQSVLPVLELGSNPLSAILAYRGQPISFELINEVEGARSGKDPQSPRLVKKYALARQPDQVWAVLKRHHNRMIIKVKRDDESGLGGRREGLGPDRNIRRDSRKIGRGGLGDIAGNSEYSFHVYEGGQKVLELQTVDNAPMITDIYFNTQDRTTTLTFVEITKIRSIMTPYSAKITVQIYDMTMKRIKRVSNVAKLEFLPEFVETFRPESASYYILIVRTRVGRYTLFGVTGAGIAPISTQSILPSHGLPLPVLRFKRTLMLLVQTGLPTATQFCALRVYSFEFLSPTAMAPKIRFKNYQNPYINKVVSMTYRELEGGQNGGRGDFVAHCIAQYLNLGSFYVKLKESVDFAPVYSNRLLEGKDTPLEAKIADDTTKEVNDAHFWDLNDDLVVKVKFGEDEEEEAGIKVWELRDHTKYSLDTPWPTKYNDRIPRMGYSRQVALLRSQSDPSLISMFFSRDTQIWDNTVIRYDLDSQESISVPDLDYVDMNMNVLALRFVYGDGSLVEKVPLKKLVRIEKIVEESDETLFLSLMIIFTFVLVLIVCIWVYYLCLKRRIQRLRREVDEPRIGGGGGEVKRLKDGEIDYSSLGGVSDDSVSAGSEGRPLRPAIELEEVEAKRRRQMRFSEKVTACFG